MHTRQLTRLAAMLLAATLLAACGGAAASQPQPTMPADMPGMDHSQMGGQTPSATTAQPDSSTAPTMTANMPGMDQSDTGGHGMAPVDASDAPAPGPEARGGQVLEATVVDGVKEFALTTSIIRWNILPDVQVAAYAYNEQVPGPTIRVTAGERVRVSVSNDLADPTSVHWHGLILPNAQDGAAEVTQPPIAPGDTFTYEFTVPDSPGTFFYHTHSAADHQQALGLYGAFIIDAPNATPAYDQEYIVQLGEWRVNDGQTLPAMELEGMLPNYFTINGKAFPATETINAKVGDQILVRFIGTGQFIHPMHIHGGPFTIVATDGYPVPTAAQLTKDTVLVGPGERYDVVWEAREQGKWLIHCHIAHHITNDGAEVGGGGGLTMVINVTL
jgi:manganese oxidase